MLKDKIRDLYEMPLESLVEVAHGVHKKNFNKITIQASSLLSLKTGGCSEDCAYCPQSAHYKTSIDKTTFSKIDAVISAAKDALSIGATRFCMGASWKKIRNNDEFEKVLEMVVEVKKLGLETCCTLGMLDFEQAVALKKSGLDYYNHNIDTSREFYPNIVSTHTFDDRLATLSHVRNSGIKVCTGGIIGLGESKEDRISFIETLTSLDPLPESLTINTLIPIKGTPLERNNSASDFMSDFVIIRVISILRILAPQSHIRLSAGRSSMSDVHQFICFYVGANSIFLGEKLLTSDNPSVKRDQELFSEIGVELDHV